MWKAKSKSIFVCWRCLPDWKSMQKKNLHWLWLASVCEEEIRNLGPSPYHLCNIIDNGRSGILFYWRQYHAIRVWLWLKWSYPNGRSGINVHVCSQWLINAMKTSISLVYQRGINGGVAHQPMAWRLKYPSNQPAARKTASTKTSAGWLQKLTEIGISIVAKRRKRQCESQPEMYIAKMWREKTSAVAYR